MFLRSHRRLGTVLVWASCSSAFFMAAGLPSARAGTGATLDLVEIETQYLSTLHTRTWYEVRIANWNPDQLQSWQAVLDPSFLGVKDFGTVELAYEPCCSDDHCVDVLGFGSTCDVDAGRCRPTFQDNDRGDWLFEATTPIAAPYLSFSGQMPNGSPLVDDASDVYGGTIVIDIVDQPTDSFPYIPADWDQQQTHLLNPSGVDIPLADYNAMYFGVPLGQCCLLNDQCIDGITKAACETQSMVLWWLEGQDCTDPCAGCTSPGPDPLCSDNNACTSDICVVPGLQCVRQPNYDTRTECCVPTTGGLYGGSDAKSDPCLRIVCNEQNMTATFEQLPVGSPCDDGDICTAHTFCNEAGKCVGLPAVGPTCPKSRYVSFTIDQVAATGCAGQRAIRVTFVDLPGFAQFNGETRWLGAPGTYPDVVPGETFTGALLQCTPHFDDFASWSLMHVFGPGVIPGATYEVQTVDISCQDLNDPGCYSAPFEMHTGAWGDVAPPFESPQYLTQPDFRDISALVDAFLGTPGAPIKARAQLQPNVPDPDNSVDFHDISDSVSAFLGDAYPYAGPNSCG